MINEIVVRIDHENDVVDRIVVVVVVDIEIEANGDKSNVEKSRYLLDYLDEVHLEQNAHSNRTLFDRSGKYSMSVVDSYDVDSMVDENDDNLNTDNVHNNVDIRTVTQFFDNYDIHVSL